MRIVFVRHGEPDYEHDCLTETGKAQAAEAAKRLRGLGITEIYASPMGRAQQTAASTAEMLGLPIRTLDYMHEILWGGPDIPDHGHPWGLSDRMVKRFFSAHVGRMRSLQQGGEEWEGSLPRARAVTRRAVVAGERELGDNPRSRSAKLRAIEKE